jgi:hypothetical protein
MPRRLLRMYIHSKVKNDVGFRREVAEKVGLGFDLRQQIFTSVHNLSDAHALQSI